MYFSIAVNYSKIIARKFIVQPIKFIFCLPFYPLMVIIYLIRPFYLIRIGRLFTSRIGHLAGNTELYCCEIDANINKPSVNYIDLFFIDEKVSNNQLLKMWKRKLIVLPGLVLFPIYYLSYFIPRGYLHRTGEPAYNDRDIYNLLDQFPVHIDFTDEEEVKGQRELEKMGIKKNDKFICLNVRDSAYLSDVNYDYHSYRDCNINNYLVAADQLTKIGFTVVRMGAKVKNKLESVNCKIIDYASNGMRSDFMDIYLGAKCHFAISSGSGWDSVPYIFRKPIVYAPVAPIGFYPSFSYKFIAIFKHHISLKEGRELTFDEIFKSGLAFALRTEQYEKECVMLKEPTPTEIWDVVSEMVHMVENDFTNIDNDNPLQKKMLNYFIEFNKTSDKGKPIKGLKVKGIVGNKFLEMNKNLL